MKARGRIKEGKIICTNQSVKQVINVGQRIAFLNCDLVQGAVVNNHPGLSSLLLNKEGGSTKGAGRGLNELFRQ